jgi:hypothetical protein
MSRNLSQPVDALSEPSTPTSLTGSYESPPMTPTPFQSSFNANAATPFDFSSQIHFDVENIKVGPSSKQVDTGLFLYGLKSNFKCFFLPKTPQIKKKKNPQK